MADLSGSDPVGPLGDLIPAGTLLDSYLLFVDPPSGTEGYDNSAITFDTKIVGVFGTPSSLTATNFLGLPGQAYSAWDDTTGLDNDNEQAVLSADFFTARFAQLTASSPGDYVRIVTLARPSDVIPEPATMTLLGSGLALAAVARRLRRN
jgi:hypothetical protein